MPVTPMRSRLTNLVAAAVGGCLCLGVTGCFSDPEKEARVQRLMAEQQSESDRAMALLETAHDEPSVESYTAVLPLMQRSDLLITWNGTSMNVDSAARGVLRMEPALFSQALLAKLEALAPELPPDDTPLAMDRARELQDYVKVLVDTVAELRITGGAGSVPSVNVFIKAEGAQGPTQLTVGYLYPYGDVRPASQVVINGSTLPPLVAHLRSELEAGLASAASARPEERMAADTEG